jgi:hypothetical protein
MRRKEYEKVNDSVFENDHISLIMLTKSKIKLHIRQEY